MIDFKKKAGGATIALDNLASVAINTSLLPATDSVIDLGSSTKYFANAYTDKLYISNYSWLELRANNRLGFVSSYAQAVFQFHSSTSSTEYLQISVLTDTNDCISWNPVNLSKGTKIRYDFWPSSDSSYNLGTSLRYWLNTYTDKLYLNATATLDGATAGHIKFTGDLVPATDDTEYIGEIGSPFKAIKGLIIKDTTDGKHYKVEVINGTVTATALD